MGAAVARGLVILGVLSGLWLAPASLHAAEQAIIAKPGPQGPIGPPIPVGRGPSALSNPFFFFPFDKLFVAHENDNNLGVIDIRRRQMNRTRIPVGTNPKGIASEWSSSRLFVANRGSNDVSVVDPFRDIVLATIPVGTAPVALTGLPCCTFRAVYVANAGSGDVSVIDPSTNTVSVTIPVGTDPSGIAFVGTDEVWVTHRGSNDVSVIDAISNTVKTLIPNVGSLPSAITPACNNEVYVALEGEQKIRVLDAVTKGKGALIEVGIAPSALIERNCGEIFVTNAGDVPGTLSIVDTVRKLVKQTFTVGMKPVAISCAGVECYGANFSDNSVTVLRFDGDVSIEVFLDGCTVCRAGDRFIARARVRNNSSSMARLELKCGLSNGIITQSLCRMQRHTELALLPGSERFLTLLDMTPLPPTLPPGFWTYFGLLENPLDGTDRSRSVVHFFIE